MSRRSSLTEEEVEHLFRIINMLRDRGLGIIYISPQNGGDLQRISDEITVMRDGQSYRDEARLQSWTMNDIITPDGRP